MTDRENRKRLGAFSTSPRLASLVCRLALDALKNRGRKAGVLDPAVGDGVFLTALGKEWKKRGRSNSRLNFFGVDIQAGAIKQTRNALRRIGKGHTLLHADFLEPETVKRLRAKMPAGFDMVIGNPPYGVKTDAGRRFGFNRDSYAAFIGAASELLAGGGVLAFLIPDTWQTIPSHAALRGFLRANYSLRAIVNVKSTYFRAAVNPCILIAVRGRKARNIVTAADFSRTDADLEDPGKSAIEALRGRVKSRSNENWAVYRYPQDSVSRFFVGTPSPARFFENKICRGGKRVRIVRIGEIAEVRHGLTTGDNRKFIRKANGANGGYKIADPDLIVPRGKVKTLSRDELENGFRKGRFDRRYLLPYDKGGRSHSAEGWLPNYFVPTRYFIDWRQSAVAKMKRLPGHRHDNPRCYGRGGITFSFAGVYCPTFRLNSPGPFDHAGCCIFPKRFSVPLLLGYLCSTPMRYLMRVFVNHTVNFGVDAVKEAFVVPDWKRNAEIERLVKAIIRNQKREPMYPYMKNEQPRIDRLVADALALTAAERREIRIWFARRYPRLGKPRPF